MKKFIIIYVMFFAFIQAPLWAQLGVPGEKPAQYCFSATHFDMVNQYVALQTKAGTLAFFNFEGYEIVSVNAQELHFKKAGFKEAMILRDKGILAMAKSAEQSREITARVEKVFCHLLAEQKKNK